MTGHFGSALKSGSAAQPQTGCQDGQTSQTDQIDQIGQTSHTGQTTHTDHTGQAGQTAELDQTGARQSEPAHARGKTVVIGSQGRMGAMLIQRAQAAGLDIAGADVPLTPEKLAHACAGAALAIICVPAAVFDEVTAAVCPHLPPTAVLADITSVKEQPLRQMERLWDGPVVGTHPLFGPSPEAGADLPVAITPGHHAGPEHLALVEGFFADLGCRTFQTSAEKHDKAMARIQNMNFITSLAYFALLAGQDDLLPFLTPSFRRRQHAARKMLTEDARLFSGLFEANAHSHEAVRQYRQMLNLAAAGDIDLLCERAGWWWQEEDGKEA